ncbi:hypothetical protein [Micromonospora yangpuensis]|uniref:Uncharacterized protein n=1 Tax=Micromonospora yangpuensis TaxID=683228 RepID=A0A1C6U280_9ACTN|nr:hypothetical protein [Micromonospora yangpuensis]SCL48117.1 hypothetical protein GA0070617_0781 [Micromonospora yangpuensis]
MTYDMVALCRAEPDAAALLGALLAAGPDLKLAAVEAAGLVQLFDPGDGRLLLTVETTRLVRVPGETERLLGVALDDSFDGRVWWVECRAPDGDPRAAETGRRFTAELVAITGGLTWASR